MRNCQKGKPCGATCIERRDHCLKDLVEGVSSSVGSARGAIVDQSATYKIAKSASPAALAKAGVPPNEAQNIRKTQLQARRTLNQLRDEGDSVVKTNGLAKEDKINWRAILGSEAKPVGSGEFGSFAVLPVGSILGPWGYKTTREDVGIKVGKIGPNEVEAIRRVGEADLGPKLIGARVSPIVKTRYKIDASDGAVAMTVVPGVPYRSSTLNAGAKSEAYWEAMGRLHRLGIAHNDLHGGNVIIDSKGQARVVDFGLAQLSYKAALAEALGAISGSNYQFAAMRNSGHALTVRSNLSNLKYELLSNYDYGFRGKGLEVDRIAEGGIRKNNRFFNKGPWAKISEDDAKKFIEILYNGILEGVD